MDTLADALPREMARVRDLIPIYESIGPTSIFAVTLMKKALDRAAVASAAGDVVEMIRALEELRAFDA